MTPRDGSRSFEPGDGGGTARAPSGGSPHIPELQSIRGLAALVVVIGHPISFYQPPDWFVTVWKLVNSQVAVEIFFILSGFVLVNSLSHQAINRITVRNFYIKRLFRIYPALWFVSAFALLYVSFLHYNIHLPDEADWFRGRFQAERYTPVHILASFAGMLAYLSPPVWTIFVEMMGSLLLPGLAWLLFTRPYWFAAAFAALLALSLGLNGSLYYHVDVYLVDFALGAAMVRLPNAPLLRLGRVVPLNALVLVALLAMMTTRALVSVDLYNAWFAQYEALLAGFIIYVYARCGQKSAVLRSRFARWLGDISYSLYLVHFTIMCVLAKLIYLAAPGATMRWGAPASSLLLCLLTISISLPVAAWMFRNVEQPGIALGRIVINRLADRAKPAGKVLS